MNSRSRKKPQDDQTNRGCGASGFRGLKVRAWLTSLASALHRCRQKGTIGARKRGFLSGLHPPKVAEGASPASTTRMLASGSGCAQRCVEGSSGMGCSGSRVWEPRPPQQAPLCRTQAPGMGAAQPAPASPRVHFPRLVQAW